MDSSSLHAVAIYIVSKNGDTPLLKDPKKPSPVYWKLPGGRGRPREDALAAAQRELQEELGITTMLECIYTESRENHTFSLFKGVVDSLEEIQKEGDEGEEIKVFTQKEIMLLGDLLFPPHREILISKGLLK
ncbi:MAG: NUDIX hydrolase [archaeon]|nr:NUDIX hydrolase [archaeon]